MVDEEPDEETDAPADASQEADEGTDGSAWNWWLVAIPVLAVLDVLIVSLYGANVLSPSGLGAGVELDHIVIAGTVALAILAVVLVVLLAGGHPDNLEDEDEPAPGPGRPAAREERAAGPEAGSSDLEALATDDEVEGRRVVEMARPPKERVDAGVYSTTYVEVDTERVLRVEELVARRAG